MNFDLTALSGGQIAVLGGLFTLLSALTAATTAVIVAKINAIAARTLARQNARREYARKTLEPLVERLDSDYIRWSEICLIALRRRMPFDDEERVDEEQRYSD